MKFLLLFLLLMAARLADTSGQSRLEPLTRQDTSWDGAYYNGLHAKLLRGLSAKPLARLIADEQILSIEHDSSDNTYWMKVNSLFGSYWNSTQYLTVDSFTRASMMERYNKQAVSELIRKPSELKLLVTARQIDSGLAVSIHTLFRAAINQAMPPEPDVPGVIIGRADGTDYEFYIYDSGTGGIRGATTWSPRHKTLMYELVEFYWKLMHFCRRPGEKRSKEILSEASLIRDAEKLLGKMTD